MKKKHTITIVVLLVCLLSLAGSAALVAIFANAGENAAVGEDERPISLETFSAWTDIDAFQDIPVISGEQIKIGDASDYGSGDYLIDVNGTTVDEYKAYLDVLTGAGFEKHSDNGEDAMDGYVYTAAFTKDNLTVVVSHTVSKEKTCISAAYDKSLSDHMIYKEEYLDGVTSDAKTTVHVLEVNDNGASIVIRLKNGHFIIHDGGNKFDAAYLLDYLEGLTPDGEKPVVEAWFISHGHIDHYGAISEISGNSAYARRIYVEGVYYHEPSPEVQLTSETSAQNSAYVCSRVNGMFKAPDGTATKLYRPQFGQRYYFCDITIDVSLTPEQIAPESYYRRYYNIDINDTSIWLMHHIEDQTLLIGGDSFHGGVRTVMDLFESSYFDVDVFVVLHHGINVYDYFTDYMTLKTILYPNFKLGSIYGPGQELSSEEGNEHIQAVAKEGYSTGNGTVVLTFPYQVGTAKILEPCDWRYNGGEPRRGDWGWNE